LAENEEEPDASMFLPEDTKRSLKGDISNELAGEGIHLDANMSRRSE